MCKVKTPNYAAPAQPEYARAKEPDNAALYEEAAQRAAQRGGGRKRSTLFAGARVNTALGGVDAGRTVLG